MASGAIDTGARGPLCHCASNAAVVQPTRTSPRGCGPTGYGPTPWHPASARRGTRLRPAVVPGFGRTR